MRDDRSQEFVSVISKGTGYPIALLPGIQGRWEWMRPTVEALTAGHRVVSWSLGELRQPGKENKTEASFLAWMRALDRAFDNVHERRLSLIGVSFGGLIAACYAARRPDRVTSLILVSVPSPVWKPTRGDRFCVNYPRLAMPYFAARAIRRSGPELYRAHDSWPLRLRYGGRYLSRVAAAPINPVASARWAREWQGYDITEDCQRIVAPTLVITGEQEFDKVVPVEDSLQYLQLIPGATHITLARTGHLGVVTTPARFAEIAGKFVYAANTVERTSQSLEERARHAS
jgi:pimeloyl-ACP methyl ester carboxylesterase